VTMNVSAIGGRSQSASATTLTPTLPIITGKSLGAYLWIVTVKSNDVITTAQVGWTKLFQDNSGTGYTAAYFIAPTTSTAGPATWASAAACSAQVIYIEDPDNPMVTNAVGASGVGIGSTSPHTSPSITTTRAMSLVLFIDQVSGYAGSYTSTPTGWTLNLQDGSPTDNGAIVIASKSGGAAGTSTGAISVTGTLFPWVQRQIEFLIVLPASGIQVTANEVANIMASRPGISVAGAELGNVMASGVGISASEVEIVLIFVPGGYPFKRRHSLILNGGQRAA
jgi:hypothetical protein